MLLFSNLPFITIFLSRPFFAATEPNSSTAVNPESQHTTGPVNEPQPPAGVPCSRSTVHYAPKWTYGHQ